MATNAAPRHAPRADPVERPRLFALLDQGSLGAITLLCAPAGSGKTMLLSSWLGRGNLPGPVAWVGVERGESDATRFWDAVIDALRGSGVVGPDSALSTLLPSPAGGHDEFLDRLIEELGRLGEPLLMVIDDLHELRSDEALLGLERVLTRAPASLRTILVSRREPKLGLHRLRLSGQLTEIRAAELEFTPEETRRAHADGRGVGQRGRAGHSSRAYGGMGCRPQAGRDGARAPYGARPLRRRVRGQRAHGRRLPPRGGARQPAARGSAPAAAHVHPRAGQRRARGSADRPFGRDTHAARARGGQRDGGRGGRRTHLVPLPPPARRPAAPRAAPRGARRDRGSAPAGGELARGAGPRRRGDPPRRARRGLAARRRAARRATGSTCCSTARRRRWAGCSPACRRSASARTRSSRRSRRRTCSPDPAGARPTRCIAAARPELPGLPPERRHRAETALATVTLLRARRVGDLGAAVDEASALLHGEGAPAGAELEALALMNLGIAEGWTLRLAESEAHLERALALGRRLERPYIEIGCLGALGTVANLTRRLDLSERHTREAIAIAERLGWSTLPIVAVADLNLAAVLIDRGRLDEGEHWLQRADPILDDAPEPAARVGLRYSQGTLAMARGQHADALAAFRECERLAGAAARAALPRDPRSPVAAARATAPGRRSSPPAPRSPPPGRGPRRQRSGATSPRTCSSRRTSRPAPSPRSSPCSRARRSRSTPTR